MLDMHPFSTLKDLKLFSRINHASLCCSFVATHGILFCMSHQGNQQLRIALVKQSVSEPSMVYFVWHCSEQDAPVAHDETHEGEEHAPADSENK